MTKIKPFIKCVDYWPAGIPADRLGAYKQLIDEGQIQKHNVVVNKQTHATVVEYYAIMPHEWVREELALRI